MPALVFFFNRTRFGGFLRRFAPLWVVWVVVWLLPLTHESARLMFRGSEVVRNLASFGDLFWPFGDYQDDFDPAPLAKKEPRNPDLAWWVHSRGRDENPYSSSNQALSDAQFGSEWELLKRFPKEEWLRAVPFRRVMSGGFLPVVNPFPGAGAAFDEELLLAPRETQKLRENARLGAFHEPDNAFWPLAHALVLLSTKGQREHALPFLERAANCPYYSDKSLEAARRLANIQSRFRRLSWEERAFLVSRNSYYYGYGFYGGSWRTMDGAALLLLQKARTALWHRDKKRALQLAGALLRLSQKLSEGDNSLETAAIGGRWQSWPRYLAAIGAAKPGILRIGPANLRAWKTFVRGGGAPELGDLADKMTVRSGAISQWVARLDNSSTLDWELRTAHLTDARAQGGAVFRCALARIAQMILVGAALLVGAFWMFANVFLVRGVGAPSTRRDRVFPAVFLGSLGAIVGFFAVWILMQPASPSVPRNFPREETIVSLAFFALFSLPFGLGLWCALASIGRHKNLYFLPPRVDLELRLSPLQKRFLRDFLPFGVACAIFTFVSGWAIWVLGTWGNWGVIDVLQLLPPDRSGSFGNQFDLSFSAREGWVAGYGIAVCVTFFAVWFFKWRFFSPPELRVLTHSGLRWWKESLGALVCFASVLFLLVALAAFPSRVQAARQIEILAQKGELYFAPGGPFLEGKNGNGKNLKKQNIVEGARL